MPYSRASAGNTSEFYVCDNKEHWSSNGVENYELRGVLPRTNGYVKEIVLGEFGEIMPLKVGAGSTTYFCDHFWTSIPGSGVSERVLLFGASATGGASAGFVYAYTIWTSANANVGSQLILYKSKTINNEDLATKTMCCASYVLTGSRAKNRQRKKVLVGATRRIQLYKQMPK